jgi:hypothetical protein
LLLLLKTQLDLQQQQQQTDHHHVAYPTPPVHLLMLHHHLNNSLLLLPLLLLLLLLLQGSVLLLLLLPLKVPNVPAAAAEPTTPATARQGSEIQQLLNPGRFVTVTGPALAASK